MRFIALTQAIKSTFPMRFLKLASLATLACLCVVYCLVFSVCAALDGIDGGRGGFTWVLHNAVSILNASLTPHTGNEGSIFIDPVQSNM